VLLAKIGVEPRAHRAAEHMIQREHPDVVGICCLKTGLSDHDRGLHGVRAVYDDDARAGVLLNRVGYRAHRGA